MVFNIAVEYKVIQYKIIYEVWEHAMSLCFPPFSIFIILREKKNDEMNHKIKFKILLLVLYTSITSFHRCSPVQWTTWVERDPQRCVTIHRRLSNTPNLIKTPRRTKNIEKKNEKRNYNVWRSDVLLTKKKKNSKIKNNPMTMSKHLTNAIKNKTHCRTADE